MTCPPIHVPERVWQLLAWKTNYTPYPTLPELIPGLTAENLRRLTEYRHQCVEWRIGRGEQLLRGLVLPNPYETGEIS